MPKEKNSSPEGILSDVGKRKGKVPQIVIGKAVSLPDGPTLLQVSEWHLCRRHRHCWQGLCQTKACLSGARLRREPRKQQGPSH